MSLSILNHSLLLVRTRLKFTPNNFFPLLSAEMFCEIYWKDHQVFASSGIKAHSEHFNGREKLSSEAHFPLNSFNSLTVYFLITFPHWPQTLSSFPPFLLKNTTKHQQCGRHCVIYYRYGPGRLSKVWGENKSSA